MTKYLLAAFEAAMIITVLMLAIIFLVWAGYLTAPAHHNDGNSYHQEVTFPG
jgi:hypothetical protein